MSESLSDWAQRVSRTCPHPTRLHPTAQAFQVPVSVPEGGCWIRPFDRSGGGIPEDLADTEAPMHEQDDTIPAIPQNLRKWFWAGGGLVAGLFVARLIRG